MDSMEAFGEAVSFTAGVVKGVAAGQLEAPTPCTQWTVRDLLNHVIGTLWLADGLFGDTPPRYGTPPGGLPSEDLVGTDPATAYGEAAAAALAAAGAGDALTRSHPSPFGEMPGQLLAGFTTLDIAVHGWDLAAATGQAAELGDPLAQHLLAFAHQTLPDAASRGDRIGPPVPVGDDASGTARLVGYLGRRP